MKFIELLAEFKNADSVEWIDACEEQPEYDAVRFMPVTVLSTPSLWMECESSMFMRLMINSKRSYNRPDESLKIKTKPPITAVGGAEWVCKATSRCRPCS